MGFIQIPFDNDMWEECRRISLARSAPKRGWSGRYERGAPSDEAHLLGVVGEAAVCVFFDARLNREIHGGDRHAPDVVVGRIGIEVKSSKYSPPHLKFNNMGEFPRTSHIAVVVHVDVHRRVATLWGWVDRRKFVEEATVKDYGYGDRLVMAPPYTDLYVLRGVYR